MGALRFLVALAAAIVGIIVFLSQTDRAPNRPDLVVRSAIADPGFNDWLMSRYVADHPGASVGIDGASILFPLPRRLDLGDADFDVLLHFNVVPGDGPPPASRDLTVLSVDTLGFAWRMDQEGPRPRRVTDLLADDWNGRLAMGRPLDDELAALWLREMERRVEAGAGDTNGDEQSSSVEAGLQALRTVDHHVRAYTDGPATTTRALVRGEADVGLLPASLARGVGLEWRAPEDWTLMLELRTFSVDGGREFVSWLRGEDITSWIEHGVLPAQEAEWLRLWELNVRGARTAEIPASGGR